MRIFSPRDKRKPLSRSEAKRSLIINQFATPGLGSLISRRFVEGLGQLLLAVAGFLMIMGWFAQITIKTYRLVNDLPKAPERFPWLGEIGAALFLLAWLWAWVTSVALLREARRNEGLKPPMVGG